MSSLYFQGYTASSSTGPSYAASGTYYLFLESSGNAGLTARLNSLQLSGIYCFTLLGDYMFLNPIIFSSPDPNGHLRYWHLSSVRKL